MSWTEGGMRSLSELHMEDHYKEDQEIMVTFQEALQKAPPKDYNTLYINNSDKAFLKTRGIKTDENIVHDCTLPFEPYEGKGINVKFWKRILEKAWSQS